MIGTANIHIIDESVNKIEIMKVYELLSFNKELLFKIHIAGIKVDDYKCVDLYTDYIHLKDNGEKVTYIVAHLCFKYGISERKVYNIISRMQAEIITANIVQLNSA